MESHSDFVEKHAASRNGHFLLEEKQGRAMLTVFPAGAGGKPVRKQDIESRIQLFGLQDMDAEQKLDEIIVMASEQPVDIGVWSVPEPVDAPLEINVNHDATSVELRAGLPRFKGKAAQVDTIQAFLKKQNIVAGVDEAAIERLVAEVAHLEKRWKAGEIHKSAEALDLPGAVVATGRAPVPGKDPEIKYS